MSTDDPYDPDFREDVPGVNRPWDAGTPPPPPPPLDGYDRPPRPPEEIRMWTIIAHVSALPAAFFGLAFMGPLVVMLLRQGTDEISAAHAKEALHFNLTVLLAGIVSFLLVFVLIGVPMLAGVGIFWFVNVLRATAAVNAGRTFRYPLTLRLF